MFNKDFFSIDKDVDDADDFDADDFDADDFDADDVDNADDVDAFFGGILLY
jgi:hypothetical protein